MFRGPRGRQLLVGTIAAAVGALAAAGPAARATTAPLSDRGATASIVGGRPASIAEFPWLAFIEGRDLRGSYSCTGTVVAPRVVLTAGHCVEDPELRASPRASAFRVRTGAADRRKAIPSAVSRVVVNPGYSLATSQGDAGLLILSAPVAAPALPLASASDSRLLAAKTSVSIAGWGLTENYHGGGQPNVLSWGSTAIQPTRYCEGQSVNYDLTYAPNSQFCAGDPSGVDANTCFGDSGGPVIAKREDGSPVEVGITSLGDAFCARNLSGIYTRVDRISTWVAGWIASVEAGGPPPGPARDRPPRLAVAIAKSATFDLLEQKFDRHLSLGDHFGLDCSPISQSKVKCAVNWTHGIRAKTLFFGRITTFYALEEGAVVLGIHFVIHRSQLNCRLHPKKRQRCPVHTRRG